MFGITNCLEHAYIIFVSVYGRDYDTACHCMIAT